jgi:hypothetical protein
MLSSPWKLWSRSVGSKLNLWSRSIVTGQGWPHLAWRWGGDDEVRACAASTFRWSSGSDEVWRFGWWLGQRRRSAAPANLVPSAVALRCEEWTEESMRVWVWGGVRELKEHENEVALKGRWGMADVRACKHISRAGGWRRAPTGGSRARGCSLDCCTTAATGSRTTRPWYFSHAACRTMHAGPAPRRVQRPSFYHNSHFHLLSIITS